MESVRYTIRQHCDRMGFAEQRLADYRLAHTGGILGISISGRAAHCSGVNATVVGVASGGGLNGY